MPILLSILTIASLLFAFWLGTITPKPTGVLKIDHSDPEKDRYLFEIDDLEKISEKSYIVLKIEHDADLSQQ